jgi:putative ATPase
MSLFDSDNSYQPLAARMRPVRPDQFLGQDHILGEGKPLREALDSGTLHSMILWGPPGVGKTTLARMVAELCDVHFEPLSAVLSGVKDIREAIARAQQNKLRAGRKTILFVDEAHRFNKAQQDAFLPHVEDGTIIFIGATTENPSFELNNALLSRTRVYKLKSLDAEALIRILDRALQDDPSLAPRNLQISSEHKLQLANASDGDARKILNLLEIAADLTADEQIADEVIVEVLSGDSRRFDKGGDIFYEQISALHKSVRGSSPDGAIYWFTRMIDGGCDPLYIARRVVRMASEDIGNADPRALQLALNAWEAQERLGSPEGHLAIAQAVLYLACAPKSNAVYTAFNAALTEVEARPSYDVPLHLRNAPTTLMEELGYGKEYHYAHDAADGYMAGESYLPMEMDGQQYYFPVSRGLEIKIAEKLAALRELDGKSSFQRYQRRSNDNKTPEEDND